MSPGGALLVRGRDVLRRRAVLLDGLAALALSGAALGAVPTLQHDKTAALTVLAALLCTTTLAWRRIAPAPAALVALSAVTVYQISGQDTNGAFISVAVMLACYLVGRRATRHISMVGVAAYGLASCTIVVADDHFSPGKDLVTWLPLIVLPIVAGRFVTRRDAIVHDLHETRARLRDERDTAGLRAVVAERTRVAREVHDVVAHCVSVMVIQAGAARLLVATDIAAAREAMRVVAGSGRTALTDLRHVVGVRRRSDDDVAASALGLAQLPHLVAQARDPRRLVRLYLDAGASVPADVDLAAFRIVQEALTNVRRHAPTASIDVRVTATTDAVEISVADTGPAVVSKHGGSGNGLIGMRERVALHGGELTAAPTADGGFAVRARLPISAPPATSATPAASAGADMHATSQLRTRRRPSSLEFDAGLSLGWLVALEIEAVTSAHRAGPLAWNVLAVAAMALAGVLRRRAPLAFVAVVGSLAVALSGGLAAPQRASVLGLYTVATTTYALGAYLGRGRALFGLGVMVAGVVATTALRHASPGTAFGGCLMACVVWLGGRIVRNQRGLIAELRSASSRLAAERDARALVAVDEERVRIARDLHTIVAGFVAGMVVQAGAVDDLLATDPALATDQIASIEQTGRRALVQLRQVLGVLRNRLDPAPRQPHLDEPASSELRSPVSA